MVNHKKINLKKPKLNLYLASEDTYALCIHIHMIDTDTYTYPDTLSIKQRYFERVCV